MQICFGIKGLELQDRVYEFKDPSLQNFIQTEGTDDQNTELVSVKVRILEETHPLFKEQGVLTDIDLSFGKLFVRFKPLTVQKVLAFLETPNENQGPNIPNLQEIEFQNNFEDESQSPSSS
jgi:hypothetical protein